MQITQIQSVDSIDYRMYSCSHDITYYY